MSILDNMHFRTLDENFNTTSILTNYYSIIWTERYNEIGDFEIHGPLNDQLFEVAKNSSYIFNSATLKMMVIEKINVEYNNEDGNTITISGRAFESILDRRVMLSQKTVYNPTDRRVSEILSNLVRESFNNTIPDRYWKALSVFNTTSLDSTKLELDTGLQFSIGQNLLEIILDFCAAFDFGFKFEFKSPDLVHFTIYAGSNHSAESTEPIVFSDLYDNLLSSKEEVSFSHLKTFGLVSGNYLDTVKNIPKLMQEVSVKNGPGRGLSRYETYIGTDQENIIYNEDGTTTIMSDNAYKAALLEAGFETMNSRDNQTIKIYDGEILENLYVYGVDFGLGDTISIRLPHDQLTVARLDGITIYDDMKEGKRLSPEFNFTLPLVTEVVMVATLSPGIQIPNSPFKGSVYKQSSLPVNIYAYYNVYLQAGQIFNVSMTYTRGIFTEATYLHLELLGPAVPNGIGHDAILSYAAPGPDLWYTYEDDIPLVFSYTVQTTGTYILSVMPYQINGAVGHGEAEFEIAYTIT